MSGMAEHSSRRGPEAAPMPMAGVVEDGEVEAASTACLDGDRNRSSTHLQAGCLAACTVQVKMGRVWTEGEGKTAKVDRFDDTELEQDRQTGRRGRAGRVP